MYQSNWSEISCSSKRLDGPLAYGKCINSQLESIGIMTEKPKPKDEKPEAEETTYDEPEDAKNDIAIPETDKN